YVRINQAFGYERGTDRAAFARVQIREANRQAHTFQLGGCIQLAQGFAFDPAFGGGEKAHLSFSQCVHASYHARRSGIKCCWLIGGLPSRSFSEGWSPRLVSRQRFLLFREALICLSYSGEMVVPAGNAPASSGYQPGALLLSYRTEIGSSDALWRR